MQQRGQRPVTIGYTLIHEQFPVPQLVELGALAEQAGFDAVWTSDHYHPWQDNQGHAGFAWVTLAAVGQRTSKIVMGTGVTCPSFRYRPPVVAEAFASLGLLYPGRVFLGVGSGEALNEVPAAGGWGDYDERSARLEEAVALIRQLWTGEWVNFDGRYFKVKNSRLYDVPKQPIPIYAAASGTRSMRLAGKIGDGLITDSPQQIFKPELRREFENAARAAGKDPQTLALVTQPTLIVGNKQDAERAASLWRFNPKAWELYVDDPDPRSVQRRAEKGVPLEQVYSQWAVSEDPEAHIQAIQKLIDGGMTHIFIQAPQPDQKKVISFFGEKVLPNLTFPRQPVGV
jgi:TAT-translocated FGD2 family F420-dependent dehydrogenase